MRGRALFLKVCQKITVAGKRIGTTSYEVKLENRSIFYRQEDKHVRPETAYS